MPNPTIDGIVPEQNFSNSPPTKQMAEEFRRATRERFANLMTFCSEVESLSHNLILTEAIPGSVEAGDYLAAMAARMITTYQGCITLAEYGLEHEAKALIRTLLEGMFRMCAVSLDRSRLQAVVLDADISRLETWKHIEQARAIHPEMFKDAPPPPDLVDLQVRTRKKRKTPVSQWAIWAELPAYYHVVYSLFCDSTHTGAKGLESQLVADGDGLIVAMQYGPSIEDVPKLLLTSAEIQLRGLRAFTEAFRGADTLQVEAMLQLATTMLAPGEAA